MMDRALRPAKDAVLRPLVAGVPAGVPPIALTALAFAAGLAAAGSAAVGLSIAGLVLWLASRLLDGLDGALARARGAATDLGGYLDFLLDVVVYSAIPLGIAVHADSTPVWAMTAVLLASFYVNAVSWTYLSAVLERRGLGADARGELTSIAMPTGLIEGAETAVLLALAIAVPSWAVWVFAAMAAGVVISAIQRALWATRVLPGAA